MDHRHKGRHQPAGHEQERRPGILEKLVRFKVVSTVLLPGSINVTDLFIFLTRMRCKASGTCAVLAAA